MGVTNHLLNGMILQVGPSKTHVSATQLPFPYKKLWDSKMGPMGFGTMTTRGGPTIGGCSLEFPPFFFIHPRPKKNIESTQKGVRLCILKSEMQDMHVVWCCWMIIFTVINLLFNHISTNDIPIEYKKSTNSSCVNDSCEERICTSMVLSATKL